MDLVQLAEELRDRGMSLASRAQEARTPGWHELAYQAIVAIARRSPVVHIDIVLAEFTLRPTHANAWGSVWMRAIRKRVIERTGQMLPCTTDARKHKHLYPVYRSLIYAREAA